ncbi:MAG TPA: cytochrome c oxidase assembly protein [Mycobacteriales bacterium]|nr:cytochrome c oxidase assembly protein [Mycobacteriales bacterium]
MTDTPGGTSALPPSARRSDRGGHGPVLVVGVVALGVAALVVVAAVRALLGSSGPVLPYSLCRSGHSLRALPELTGRRLLTSWQADPVVLVALAGAVLLYGTGLRRLARRGERWPIWRACSFGAGIAVVLLAVCSSIAVYDMTLFWAHMVQHLMLIMLAPVFLVMGRPLTLLLAASRPPTRARIEGWLASRPGQLITSPAVALALYTAVIVGAHLTGLTDQVLGDVWAGQLEHLVYLLAGVLFFQLLFGDEPIHWQLSMPGRQLLLMFAMAVDTFVGVVLLQSTVPVSTLAHPGWGPTPVSDTQAGGAVMWVGGDGLMALLAIALYLTWARRPQSSRTQLSMFERARIGLAAQRAEAEHSADPAVATAALDMDADERAWQSYNRWLERLNREG